MPIEPEKLGIAGIAATLLWWVLKEQAGKLSRILTVVEDNKITIAEIREIVKSELLETMKKCLPNK